MDAFLSALGLPHATTVPVFGEPPPHTPNTPAMGLAMEEEGVNAAQLKEFAAASASALAAAREVAMALGWGEGNTSATASGDFGGGGRAVGAVAVGVGGGGEGEVADPAEINID